MIDVRGAGREAERCVGIHRLVGNRRQDRGRVGPIDHHRKALAVGQGWHSVVGHRHGDEIGAGGLGRGGRPGEDAVGGDGRSRRRSRTQGEGERLRRLIGIRGAGRETERRVGIHRLVGNRRQDRGSIRGIGPGRKAQVIDCQALGLTRGIGHLPDQPKGGAGRPVRDPLVQNTQIGLIEGRGAVHRQAARGSRIRREDHVQAGQYCGGISGQGVGSGRVHHVEKLESFGLVRLAPKFSGKLEADVIEVGAGAIDEPGGQGGRARAAGGQQAQSFGWRCPPSRS